MRIGLFEGPGAGRGIRPGVVTATVDTPHLHGPERHRPGGRPPAA